MPASALLISPSTWLTALEHALAAKAVGVLIAQFQRLKLAGGRAAGHRGGAFHAVDQRYDGFDGRVAAGIDNLAPMDFLNRIRHMLYLR
jgi:hypothetical protein